MGQPVQGEGQDTGCIQVKEGFFLIIRYNERLLFPHMDRVAVQHGGVVLDEIMAFEDVYPDDEDKLDTKDCQYYVC